MKTNKKVIRLTESDLHRIVNESVKHVITENRNASVDLEQAYNILNSIAKSGFIPFSSPSPSSSEQRIKNSIISAMKNIEMALQFCHDCGY